MKGHRNAVFRKWAEEEGITPAAQAARALSLTQEVETQMRSEFESINGQFDRVFAMLADGPSTVSRRPSARSSSPPRGIATAPAPTAGYAGARSSAGQGTKSAPAVPPTAPPAGPATEYAAAYVAAHVRAPPPLPALTPSEVSPASAAPRTVRVAFGAPLPPLMAQPPAVAQPPA